jgi:glycosyltransferase involved in cell wall biosynthesis
MRVLHLLPHARALGGTERTVIDLLAAPELAHVTQRVAFVQPGRVHGFPSSQILGGRAAHLLPGGSLPSIVRWRPDIIHGWLLQGNALGAALKPLLRGTLLITSERHSHASLGGPRPLLERLVAHAEDVVTGNSSAVREAVVGRLPGRGERFRVILPGVAALRADEAPRATTAVMVGRVHPDKDHLTALRTWRRVVDRVGSATLTIVGGGPELTALQAVARELGVGANVVFRGEADPAADLAGAQIFLSTSRAEGFSRAVLEALAAGVPVVSTDVGGVGELRGEAVRVAPVGDDAALAQHMLDWLDDPSALAAAAAATRRVAERFSPTACHAHYARLYDELLSGRGRRSPRAGRGR